MGQRKRRIAIFAAAITALSTQVATGYSATSQASATGTGGVFVATQGRVLDTRAASTIGGYTTPMSANVWRSVQIGGVAGVPSTGAGAVQVSITALTPSATGTAQLGAYATSPVGETVLDYGVTTGNVTNTAVVAVASNGKIDVKTSTSINILIDVQGYYTTGATAGGGYVPIEPVTIVDSTDGTGDVFGPLAAGTVSNFSATDFSNIPVGASAVFVNITVVNHASSSGYITPYKTGTTRPTTSFNYPASATTAIGTEAAIASDGSLNIYNSNGPVDLVITAVGYFDGSGGGDGFTPAQSTITTGLALPSGSLTAVKIAGVGGLPAVSGGLDNVALSVQATATASSGASLSVWSSDDNEPDTTSLTMLPKAGTVSNFLVTAVGSDGNIEVHNSGPDSLTVSIYAQGWYTGAPVQVATSDMCSQPTTTSCTPTDTVQTTTPQLTASTTDPASKALTYSFEVWQYSDGDEDSINRITSGTVGSIASGSTATWQVPSGQLSTDEAYQYRVRANDGTSNSIWSPWYAFFVYQGIDIQSVTSNAYAEDDWTAASSTPLDLAVVTTNGATVSVSVDGGSATSSSGPNASFSLPAPSSGGVHDAVVTATSSSGVSVNYDYQFFVGSAPAAPSSVSIATGLNSVSVTWGGASSNGSAVSGYSTSLTDQTTGGTTYLGDCASSCSSISVGSLTPGDVYTASVSATSDAGAGSSITSTTFSPKSAGAATACSGSACWQASAATPDDQIDSTLYSDGSRLNIDTNTNVESFTNASNGTVGDAATEYNDETASGSTTFDVDQTDQTGSSHGYAVPSGFRMYGTSLRNAYSYHSAFKYEQNIYCKNGECDYNHPRSEVRVHFHQTNAGSGRLHEWDLRGYFKRDFGAPFHEEFQFWCGVNIPKNPDYTCDKHDDGFAHAEVTPFSGFFTGSGDKNTRLDFGYKDYTHGKYPMFQFDTSWDNAVGAAHARYRGWDTFYTTYNNHGGAEWLFFQGDTGTGR